MILSRNDTSMNQKILPGLTINLKYSLKISYATGARVSFYTLTLATSFAFVPVFGLSYSPPSSSMGNAFHRPTLKEQLRANKRLITRAIREMDRERMSLEREQKKLQNDIKKMAKQNQINAVRIMAKDLVRTKQYIEKFYTMRSQLQAVNLRLQTMKTSEQMTRAMKGVTKAMGKMNKKMNVQSIQKIMMEFERQNQQMEMTEEMMGDAMDDAFDDAETEEEQEKIVGQVLDELGISMGAELAEAPTAAPAQAAPAEAENNAQVSELEARLDQLRRD